MSVGTIPLYNAAGLVGGSFLYLLICQDSDTPVFVKVGMTNRPFERLRALRSGCPVTPRVFAYVEVRSRKVARDMERSMMFALKSYKAHLEWFKFEETDKALFNQMIASVLVFNHVGHVPLKWTKIQVQAMVNDDRRRVAARFASEKRRGVAYQDFVRHTK